MNYAVQVDLTGIKYRPSFMKVGSDTRVILRLISSIISEAVGLVLL
jgi:hypothetical protein